MLIPDAQREMRAVFLNGAIGQAVSGALWLLSAILGTLISVQAGLWSLFLGGMFIFPLTQLALKLLGRPNAAQPGNALNGLARQVAFVVPLCLPVIIAAQNANVNWYYPAFAIVVGAHYLPFMFLYGIWEFAILAGLLIGGGTAIGMLLPGHFTPAAWFTAIVLIAFALYLSKRR